MARETLGFDGLDGSESRASVTIKLVIPLNCVHDYLEEKVANGLPLI